MHRGIAAYFIILVLLVIVAIYLYASNGGGAHTTSTITTFTTIPRSNTTLTTTISGNSTTSTSTTQTTSTVYYAGCVSGGGNVVIPNGNFSTGTYANWTATGPGFGSEPFNLTKANMQGAYYAAPWSGYNGVYMATTYTTGTALQAGNLTSRPFSATQLYLNFKIISSQSSALYVEILEGSKPVITTHYNTYVSPPGVANPQSAFVNASIPLATLLCQNVSIRLVAGVTGSSAQGDGYVAAGDFYLSKNPGTQLSQPVNQTISS